MKKVIFIGIVLSLEFLSSCLMDKILITVLVFLGRTCSSKHNGISFILNKLELVQAQMGLTAYFLPSSSLLTPTQSKNVVSGARS